MRKKIDQWQITRDKSFCTDFPTEKNNNNYNTS